MHLFNKEIQKYILAKAVVFLPHFKIMNTISSSMTGLIQWELNWPQLQFQGQQNFILYNWLGTVSKAV
jgi:hypothetical protein